MRINITIPSILFKDTKKYISENGLKMSEIIRHLLRIEIYHEKSLERGCENEQK